ncbi:hypothetical protein [Marinifilum caeruleilacunae]|uniref:DUF1579 domain-containing protein n=1 Tax=Marinifilum caeruleilacunae TaxID=2499076 RepID=A0ABX1WR87_9BACT|nr:hypothetical protein [Marinifilum caeruleilacunae]NOU58604.1 hypothetical protein [Marinifilum caeruleilacunae]
MRTLVIWLAVICMPCICIAQEKPEPVDQFRQFDFWLGEWDVYTGENMVGKNKVVLLQNKHVIQENWVSEKENFTGTSYSFYNPKTKKWHQVWVDRNGSNLLLVGEFTNGKMVLTSGMDSNMGEPNSKHKITWSQLANGDVKQVWESTTDDGKSWNIQFEGIYKKAN